MLGTPKPLDSNLFTCDLAAANSFASRTRHALGRSGSSPRTRIIRIGVTLLDLSPATERQLDLLLNDDRERRRWEAVTTAIDSLNRRYGRTVLSIGPWVPPPGGNAGGKISYTRIPSAEDFW